MFRMFIVSLVIGILTFLMVYFVSPFILSESDIVSIFAGFALDFSNLNFDSMPPLIASYINKLDLLVVALTVGLLTTIFVQLLVMSGSLFVFITKWIISSLRKEKTVDDAPELSPIDMDLKFKSSAKDEKVLGRGLDSIDQD